jgi:hypothetical protein
VIYEHWATHKGSGEPVTGRKAGQLAPYRQTAVQHRVRQVPTAVQILPVWRDKQHHRDRAPFVSRLGRRHVPLSFIGFP